MSLRTTALSCLLTLSAFASAGCTFYTACPTGNTNPPAGGTGNTAGSSATGAESGAGGAGPLAVVTEGKIPPGEWLNVTPDVGDQKDLCGPFFNLVVYPDRDKLILGAFFGLWSTEDGGSSWAPMGKGKGSEPTDNRLSQIIFDPAVADGFWEVGIYGPGLFRTDDAGDTFKRVGDLMYLDSVGIDLTDPDRKTMLASVHEQPVLQKSVDAGKTWKDIYANLPPKTKHCSFSLVQDADTYLLACGGGNDAGDPKILRTTDGGDNWKQVHDGGGYSQVLVHSDGTLYWPEEGGALTRSTDAGESWRDVVQPGVLLQLPTVELPDGRLASLTEHTVVVSDDGGDTWKTASAELPFKDPSAFVYSPFQKAFFISRFACYGSAMPSMGDELMRFDFDFEKY